MFKQLYNQTYILNQVSFTQINFISKTLYIEQYKQDKFSEKIKRNHIN